MVSQPKLIIKLFVFRNIFSHGQSTRTHAHDLQRKDMHLLFRGWLVEYPKSRKKGLGRKNCTSSVDGGGRRLRLTYAEEVTRPLCPSLSDKEAGTYSRYNIRFIDSTCLHTSCPLEPCCIIISSRLFYFIRESPGKNMFPQFQLRCCWF